jgi:hypothetical protein
MTTEECTMHHTPELDVLVRQILTHPEGHPWTLQGFGMLRTDLMGRDYRLHVWDRRFQTDEVATIHDHPWGLESLVLSGAVSNVEYEQAQSRYNPTHRRVVIQPGIEGAQLSPVTEVVLKETCRSTYRAGDGYALTSVELHETLYMTGTVTLIRRLNRATSAVTGDEARVYWPITGPDEWVEAKPRPATDTEVRAICDVALAMWGEVVP